MPTERLPHGGLDPTPTTRDPDQPPRPLRTMPVGIEPTAPPDGDSGAPDDPEHVHALVGRILSGRYEVRGVLGRGGMGIVYDGRHIAIGRSVAIKVLRRDLARSTQAVARFQREAQAAALIGSPHIVEVLDYGYAEEGQAFLVMERLEGEDLGRMIRREGALPEARAVAIARQVAKALSAAHAKGIIHRDLKSENVFAIERDGLDFVKLLDFGISKITEGDDAHGPMTSEGVLMGTPHYMAPEQAISAIEADHRIDLYALGCLLYEMLTGRVPFTGKNPVEVVFKHVHEAPVPPSRVRPDAGISPEVEAVVMKLLAKDRDQRYAKASDVVASLPASGSRVSIVEPRAPSSPTSGSRPRAITVPPPMARWRMASGAFVAAAGLVATSAFLIGHHHPPAPNRPSRGVAPTDGGIALVHAAPGAGNAVFVRNDAGAQAIRGRITATTHPSTAAIALVGRAPHIGRLDAVDLDFDRPYEVVVSEPGYVTRTETVVLSRVNPSRNLGLIRLASVRPITDASTPVEGVHAVFDQNVEPAADAGEGHIRDLTINPYLSPRR